VGAEELLDKIKQKLDLVEDYSVEVEVSVDMDFLRMPKSKAELFYKKPDRFKFRSNSFAILPKAGIDFNPQKILDSDFSAEIITDTVLSESFFSLIRIFPESDSASFIKADLLLDTNEFLLLELNLIGKNGSSVLTKFSYEDQKEFSLPSLLNVNFSFSDDPDTKNNRRRRIPENFKGSLTIQYNNYVINQGLEDSIFDDENGTNEESIEN
jgi:hypothetical protein